MAAYLPVLVITAVLLAASAALGPGFMSHFMGLFMAVFAMFKLFDVPGFADGFQKYDLIGKRLRVYALAYPFIELGLGLACLANLNPPAVNTVVLIFMIIGAIGVLAALRKGLDVTCACLGTALRMPLSTVALLEYLVMGVLAGIMLASPR